MRCSNGIEALRHPPDEFKHSLFHGDNSAAELAPHCCRNNGPWFRQKKTTLPHVPPIGRWRRGLQPMPHRASSGKPNLIANAASNSFRVSAWRHMAAETEPVEMEDAYDRRGV